MPYGRCRRRACLRRGSRRAAMTRPLARRSWPRSCTARAPRSPARAASAAAGRRCLRGCQGARVGACAVHRTHTHMGKRDTSANTDTFQQRTAASVMLTAKRRGGVLPVLRGPTARGTRSTCHQPRPDGGGLAWAASQHQHTGLTKRTFLRAVLLERLLELLLRERRWRLLHILLGSAAPPLLCRVVSRRFTRHAYAVRKAPADRRAPRRLGACGSVHTSTAAGSLLDVPRRGHCRRSVGDSRGAGARWQARGAARRHPAGRPALDGCRRDQCTRVATVVLALPRAGVHKCAVASSGSRDCGLAGVLRYKSRFDERRINTCPQGAGIAEPVRGWKGRREGRVGSGRRPDTRKRHRLSAVLRGCARQWLRGPRVHPANQGHSVWQRAATELRLWGRSERRGGCLMTLGTILDYRNTVWCC